jgi:general secretion pathway protein D
MRTRFVMTGVVAATLLGAGLWLAAAVAANRAMAQEQRAAAQAEQAEAVAQQAERAAALQAARAAELTKQAAAIAEARLVAPPTDDSMENNNVETKKLLAERMEATFEQQPLAEVLTFLAERLSLEVHSQRGEIEAAGLSLDAPVTLKFKSIRGDMLLDLALRQVSTDLGYMIRDGIVIVATRDALSGNQVVRVYNCRDLLVAAAKATPAAPMGSGAYPPGVSQPGPGPASVMAAGGGSMGGLMSAMMGSGGPATPADQLQRVVRTTIAPESWDQNGGAGTMEEFGGMLVVNQSEAVHDRIERLLQMLREAAAKE